MDAEYSRIMDLLGNDNLRCSIGTLIFKTEPLFGYRIDINMIQTRTKINTSR